MTYSVASAVSSGALVGFMLGLLGGGGSILATPLLLYVVGVSQPHGGSEVGGLPLPSMSLRTSLFRALANRGSDTFIVRCGSTE
ncbi:hypothetical protein SAMN02927900_06001 [Rhizobium mongolense subsp. loessense]|uniref:Uncharacterized protein n=1 Tax=Rhizobium mongolense subsp. loessense TaxID=158890 RepID=A0A1G4U2F4_9HYPH|nr:hypothetical protein SAMN02927900_06001 [Rhizobium mongolense subsp. loessense]